MRIEIATGPIANLEGSALLLWKFAGKPVHLPELPAAVVALVRRLEEEGEVHGDGETTVIHLHGTLPAKRLVVAGLGKESAFSLAHLRNRVAESARRARDGFGGVMVVALEPLRDLAPVKDLASAVAESVLIGTYRFDRYLTKKPSKHLTGLTLACLAEHAPVVNAAVREAEIVSRWVNFAKDLCNEPPNMMTPAKLALSARRAGEPLGLRVKVLGGETLRKQGFGLLTAVGQGSVNEPTLTTVEYWGAGPDVPALALVGKGITFDSGGLNIKPSESMVRMKYDMTGAAVVLATVLAAAELKLPLNIIASVPSAENMPGGTAVRPGDIVTAFDGTTVEIIDADAEGRLILADAIAHVRKNYALGALIDAATLTVSARGGIGNEYTPYFATNEELSHQIERAAAHAGELFWRLPLSNEYKKNIQSSVADIQNKSFQPPATVTAALFLAHFVGSDLPWMHCDIAVAADASGDNGLTTGGATGKILRTFIRLTQALADAHDLFSRKDQ